MPENSLRLCWRLSLAQRGEIATPQITVRQICAGFDRQPHGEVRAPNAPRRIGMLDGYLTVDFGTWHFHLCIGDHKGTAHNPTSPELAQHRRTARAELYRRLRDNGQGLRLLNGHDEQQMTVFLPNPYLTVEQKILKEPRWEHLAMWDHLRKTYLGLEPDPKDRDIETVH